MVRLLYLVDEAYPTTSANGRIVYRIIDELIKHCDIKISVLCRAANQEQLPTNNYNGCNIIHTPMKYATKVENLKKKLGKHKWLRFFLFPRSIYFRFSGERDYYMAEAKLWIKRHLDEFDVIVANSMPFYPLELAAKFGDKVPVVFYKMEPVARYLDPNNYEFGKKNENDWDNKARAIVMEDLTYKYYKQYASKENLKKVTVAKYPCIVRPNEVPLLSEMLNKDVCNLVYVGKFYYKKRDPAFLFSLMDALHGKAMHLTIAGSYLRFPQEEKNKYFVSKKTNITYLGEVSAQQADALLDAADVLVHIGNKVSDQMPSKILSYVSAGKPILNIFGIDDCPTLPYLEKYPLVLNIKESEEITDELVGKVYQFVQQTKGKQVPFSQIEKQFEDCTPRYVGQQFYDIIKSITE